MWKHTHKKRSDQGTECLSSTKLKTDFLLGEQKEKSGAVTFPKVDSRTQVWPLENSTFGYVSRVYLHRLYQCQPFPLSCKCGWEGKGGSSTSGVAPSRCNSEGCTPPVLGHRNGSESPETCYVNRRGLCEWCSRPMVIRLARQGSSYWKEEVQPWCRGSLCPWMLYERLVSCELSMSKIKWLLFFESLVKMSHCGSVI